MWSKLVEIEVEVGEPLVGGMGREGGSDFGWGQREGGGLTSGSWRSSQAGGSSLVRLALVPSLTLHPGMRPDLSSSSSNFSFHRCLFPSATLSDLVM